MCASESLPLRCDRGSQNVVCLCDWHKAIILTCSAHCMKTYASIHKQTHKHKAAHKQVCVHTLSNFKRICQHTPLKTDCSVTLVMIQAVITVTGRTFN